MTQSTLTEAEAKKLKGIVGRVQGLPKDEKAKLNTERFADKYLRFKLGRRGTGPHSHGLSTEQRAKLTAAIRKGFGLPEPKAGGKPKATPVKAKAPAKRKTAGTSVKAGTPPAVAQPGTGARSVSELAGAQQARAAQS
jgi:hypothetical protein